MELLSLNDDVLRTIFDKLYGKNALNLALTSRRVHDLAVHRVAAVVVCTEDRELRLLHRHLFFGSSPRAQYLESLTVLSDTFLLDDETYDIRPTSPLPVDEDFDWSQIRLLVDILMNARNLRLVALPFFHPAVARDLRLGSALCALPSLISVQLDTVGDTMVTTLVPLLPRSLRILELKYHTDNVYPGLHLPGEPSTFPPLLNTLASFPALHTFRLKYFPETQSFRELGRGYSPPLLPAVRSLVLEDVKPAALDLVQLCPNLTDLEIDLCSSRDPLTPVMPERVSWPPLHSLDIMLATDVAHVMRALGPVRSLILRGDVCVSEPANAELALVLDIVERAAPTAMFLSLKVGPRPMNFWGKVVVRAPHLRVLELRLDTKAPTLEYLGWLDTVSDALRPLKESLVLVRIMLPRMPHYVLDSGNKLVAAKRALVATLEEDRARAAQVLPQRLADALPKLRFVGVCEARPSYKKKATSRAAEENEGTPCAGSEGEEESNSGAVEHTQGVDEGVACLHSHDVDEHSCSSEADYSESSSSLEWDWDAHFDAIQEHGDPEMVDVQRPQFTYGWMLKVAYRRWWRVRPNGDAQGRTLEEISETELERAQRFLEEADDEQVARVDESIP